MGDTVPRGELERQRKRLEAPSVCDSVSYIWNRCLETRAVEAERTPVILATQKAEIRRTMVQGQPRQTVCKTLSPKYPTQNRAGRVAEVVECLPSKHEVLSSNHSMEKKKKKSLEKMNSR
jgi:hypothetical protein